jgi:hypothetical protein
MTAYAPWVPTPRDETAEFDDCVCTRETDKAILVRCDGKEAWIPKSQVHEDSEVYEKDTDGKLIITLWWAETKRPFE